MGTRTFALSFKIVSIFGPKTAIFAPKYAFLGTYHVGQFPQDRGNGQNVALKMFSAWSYVAHLEP